MLRQAEQTHIADLKLVSLTEIRLPGCTTFDQACESVRPIVSLNQHTHGLSLFDCYFLKSQTHSRIMKLYDAQL